MSAYSELRETGQLGEEGVRLLYDTVRRVGRRFPPPGGGSWDSDKYTEAAHDFLTSRTTNPITSLFAIATDDDSFGRLLTSAVLNFFRSLARQSERAKLLRRINTVLEEDERFVRASDRPLRWVLRGQEGLEEFSGTPHLLYTAAWQAEGIAVARWRSATRTYVSDRESIAAFAHAVLEAASGPVNLDLLLDVAAHRFDLREPPSLIDIDDVAVSHQEIAYAPDEAMVDAEALWSQLTEQERAALPFLDASVREAARALGLGKTTAANVLRRLKTLLADTVGSDGAVIVRLQELAVARTQLDNRPSV